MDTLGGTCLEDEIVWGCCGTKFRLFTGLCTGIDDDDNDDGAVLLVFVMLVCPINTRF